jgi:lipid-A-disaccharide synthase-like uncharacterized protein
MAGTHRPSERRTARAGRSPAKGHAMHEHLEAILRRLSDSPIECFWVVFGLLGQGLFFMRFFIQWIASERKKQSVVPIAFWYFSIGGGLMLLVYACYKGDIVFILGQGGGLVIYVRNLVLIYRHKARTEAAADPPGSAGDSAT